MEGIDTVAQLMAMAAITAPKTPGENFVQVKLLQGAAHAILDCAACGYEPCSAR